MKLKYKISAILLFSMFCLFIFACNKPKYRVYGKDPFPQINLPVFPDAVEVHHVINRPTGAKAVLYKVKIKWPAQDLVDFYNSEFNKMGLSRYSKDNYGGGGWELFVEGSPKGKIEGNRYFETWVDKNNTIRILLIFTYKSAKNSTGAGEVSVNCQINKFYDFTKLNEFYEKLRKQNKEGEFNTMIGKYLKGNNELDIEKAIKENPDNAELREFSKLIKE